ncbi:MAG: DNA repair protein RecN [Flavobacterium sp.]|nr:MAG: DNA repair protein RecN [Flavobacterium sp.]
MITSLSIENFALIEKLSIGFNGGFSIITGETGAGKSILLGALGLALGRRADLSSLKNKDQKCIIEAQFDVSGYNLEAFFEANDLDYDAHTIIRREILPSGKSRSFINDSPVNLQELQLLGDFLIDIHSQHETRSLSEVEFQFRIIDALAGNRDALQSYQTTLAKYKSLQAELDHMEETLRNANKQQDYNGFLLEELLAAQLVAGEQEELEAQLDKLNNVELIRENLVRSVVLSNDDQIGVLRNMREIRAALQKIAAFSIEYNDLYERLQASLIELDDIVREMENLAENIAGDPESLQKASQKLQVIYDLQKKHQTGSVEELIEIRERLDSEALSLSGIEERIEKYKAELQVVTNQLNILADHLHEARMKTAPVLAAKLSELLHPLGMPAAQFDIKIERTGRFLANGMDDLQFLFSANKGSRFGPISKIASGGELSRIMLAVKSVMAEYTSLPTIIFDEIDTGVSGEIADKMGEIMKAMGAKRQVFAITHLPQIAAKGSIHFKVFKRVIGESTESQLRLLSHEERIAEIAQMLSGSAVSESAINHAKALLD